MVFNNINRTLCYAGRPTSRAYCKQNILLKYSKLFNYKKPPNGVRQIGKSDIIKQPSKCAWVFLPQICNQE